MPKTVILIVEDEPVQRMNMIDMVERAGYEVVEASNADQAVEILERRLDIRIVFTDIEMPGSMDGLKLAAAVRDRWPPIEIIVTTAGQPPDPERLPARSIFVSKPIRRAEAIAAIETFAA